MSSAPSPPAGADTPPRRSPSEGGSRQGTTPVPPTGVASVRSGGGGATRRSPDDVETAATFRADVARIVAAGETVGWEAATRLAEQEREQT